MRRKGVWIFFGIAVTMMVIIAALMYDRDGVQGEANNQEFHNVVPVLTQKDLTGQPVTFDAFRKIAERMNPTVVEVYTTQIVQGINPFQDFGNDPFFRRFFGEIPQGPQRQNALGSGVIIDSDGLILTNNHVVEKAEEIRVSLENQQPGDPGIEAKVVGRDPKTDLALIQIQTKVRLKAAPLGDSNQLKIGDWVIAIGNPFNLGHTVTVGVVSAKSRILGGPYDDFIQTDASINPGNSGGPLLNWRGEVVGINTAIASRTGQSAGIGFAIPINIAKAILPQLREKGRVIRSQLGVTIQSNWNQELEKEFGVDHGAIVTAVAEDSPAQRAGIHVGDVIVEYNGHSISDGRELSELVANTVPGSKVNLKVIRDKKETSLTATVQEMKETQVAASGFGDNTEKGKLGMMVANLDESTARQLNLQSTQGIVITDVELNSAADRAGLQRGDVILEVNRKPINDVNQFRDIVRNTQEGSTLLFLIHRSGGTMFIAVPIPKR
jgi:serine protease Do